MNVNETECRTVAFLAEKLEYRPAVAALSEEARTRLIEDASARWRGRVGTLIAKRLSRRQTADFKRAMEAGDDDLCRRYLAEAAPDSNSLVRLELEKILDETEQSASMLLNLDLAHGRSLKL